MKLPLAFVHTCVEDLEESAYMLDIRLDDSLHEAYVVCLILYRMLIAMLPKHKVAKALVALKSHIVMNYKMEKPMPAIQLLDRRLLVFLGQSYDIINECLRDLLVMDVQELPLVSVAISIPTLRKRLAADLLKWRESNGDNETHLKDE